MKRAWTSADIFPSGGSLTLLGIATTTDGLIVEAEGPGSARCPSCRHQSVARHSRYWRTIKDLPAHGQAVTLRVRVGR
jgi:transposase